MVTLEAIMKFFNSLKDIMTINSILDIEQRISGIDYLKKLEAISKPLR